MSAVCDHGDKMQHELSTQTAQRRFRRRQSQRSDHRLHGEG